MMPTLFGASGINLVRESTLSAGWRGAGALGGAQRLASTDGGAQRQDPDVRNKPDNDG